MVVLKEIDKEKHKRNLYFAMANEKLVKPILGDFLLEKLACVIFNN
jgi:hypothetical protein